MKHYYNLPGKPIIWQRPRPTYRGSYINPHQKELDAARWKLKFQAPELLYTGPLHIDIMFFMPIPSSYSDKKKREKLNNPHFSRPDLDNMVKGLLDACSGLYKDDAQIARISAFKVYSNEPRTVFSIESIEQT